MRRGDRLRRLLRGTLATGLVTGGACVRPLALLLARWDWRADLLTVFALPAVLAAVLAAACWQARRRPGAALAFLVAALAQAAPPLRYAAPNPVAADPARPERLRLMLLNVYENSVDHEAVARLIEAERPDIVGLVEFSYLWLLGLEHTGIRATYPQRSERARGYQGVALWSRLAPVRFGRPELAYRDGNPYLTMTFDFAGRERTLWLLHAPNPLRQPERATPDLLATGALIGRTGGSNLVMGDLNRTDGSPHFAAFAAALGLRDSRLGFGPQPSWPAWAPYEVAIDHVFVPDDLAVVARRTGPNVGSDHRAVVIDLAPARNSATNAR
jgi:endonuclease/exonuclease/phosphatase (EEP) superfamily protein YafD